MLDPDRPGAPDAPVQPEPPVEPEPPAERAPTAELEPTAELDLAAEPQPEIAPAPPPKAYELPTARKVVATGLQLSLASSSELRRASIYIGLLILAAFGPAVVAVLLVIGRLGERAGDVFQELLFSPETLAETQPELGGVLIVLMLVAIGGLTSYIAISIDAGNIAVAILGGRSAEQPMRLWEAITRARQVFWRVAGAGFLVGLVGGTVQLALTALVESFTTSVETSSVVTTVLGTLILAPFAYIASCIVLGDVGAVEALSRSWRLFRVRPWLAVVVVLFTLVTSAIQLFALSAGLDLLIRAGELLHVSLTEGAFAFLIAVVLILAALTAFGSLLFTVGAIVAAPQVAGFLGLTFFSGGLDRARSPEPRAPKGFRWVTRPMLALLIATTAVVGVEIPAINSLEPAAAGPIDAFLRTVADPQGREVSVIGPPDVVDDPPFDAGIGAGVQVDILAAEIGTVRNVPGWLINTTLDCTAARVGCDAGGSYSPAFYEEGALVVAERLAAPPSSLVATDAEWGAVLVVDGAERAPFTTGLRFSGGSHAYVTHQAADGWETVAYDYDGTAFRIRPTDARSIWVDNDLLTLIPIRELGDLPSGWDAYASGDGLARTEKGRDTLRNGPMDEFLEFALAANYAFIPKAGGT
jgi:hypothetical protein